MQFRALLNLHSDSLHALPIAILYITDKCNSRCITCDYWRHGQNEISMELVRRLARELPRFGARYILLSGGEPLQHPQWESIAAMFREKGMRVAMVTSGILLSKHAAAVASCLNEIYVSLDGATPASYKAIRGVDGFGRIKEGVEELGGKIPITIRTTVQRLNYAEIPALIRLSRAWGATRHSFLAVDVSTHAAFARTPEFDRSMALKEENLEHFARVLDETERDFDEEFRRGYIAESPDKLRLLHGYFSALLGLQEFPRVRCNAPRFSAVIETDGSVKPCFFLPRAAGLADSPLPAALNVPSFRDLRRQQRLGVRPECTRCVCPAYKGARDLVEEAV